MPLFMLISGYVVGMKRQNIDEKMAEKKSKSSSHSISFVEVIQKLVEGKDNKLLV